MVDRLHPRREIVFGESARMVGTGRPVCERRHQDQSRDPFGTGRGTDDGRRAPVAVPDRSGV